MAINRQKLKLLYLMRMLEEETDAERGLTMAQIIGKLEALGISAERKSIYRDIEALREFGVDVRTYQRAPVEYAVEHRAFAFAELQLLVDAVQSSRFLTQRKSDALVEGVKQLASRRQRALLDKRVHVEGRIKMQNESVFGSVDRIQEAIALKRRISFVYFKYDAAKRKALQHNGERYIETPVQLVYAEGYYYLVVFNEKHDDFANYRVDRMDRIEVLDEPALKNERIATFDARELESRAFGMYSGEPVAATLLVDEEVMGAVIDRFNNPFVKHALLAISLNSVSKWRARCMPSLLEYVQRKGELPCHLAFSLAALLDFYQGTEIRDGALIGHRNGEEYPIRDDAPVLAFFAAHSQDAPQALTHAFLSNVDFFGQDLTQVPGLENYVAQALTDIRAKGMRQAMAERFPVKG